MIWHKEKLITLSALTVLVLAGCGNGEADDSEQAGGNGEDEQTEEQQVELPTAVENEGEAIDGGTLKVALVSDSPFTGILSWEHYDDSNDSTLLGYASDSIFSTDEQFKITDEGMATLDLDQENNVATITFQEGLLWSDGEPLTVDDYVYSYEIIGHPDYTGIRYDDSRTNIVGMEEYKSGEADSISGITVVDDQTVEIQFKEVDRGMLQDGGSIWSYASPRHQLEDIPVADLASSPEVRENPVTYGPFSVESVVPGESVHYVANENYYLGKPKIDAVDLEVVPSSSIVAALKSGEYDLASLPSDQYETYKDLSGYTLLGRDELSYSYIGFKLGEFDAEKNEVVPDPDAKMADKSLRQAIGYAVDFDAIGTQFYNGLRRRANSAIVPAFGDLHNSDLEGYTYDPEKAIQLLDEAGFEDVDGDGIREDQNGEPLTINLASASGGETAEPVTEYFIQSWEQIGLKVELIDGRLMEFNAYSDRLLSDDPAIDIYTGAWGVGADPTPDGLYGRRSPLNLTRWASEENDQLLAELTGSNSFDEEFRTEKFHEWQEYFAEEAVAIPSLYSLGITAVNDRIKSYDIGYDVPTDYGLHSLELTADQPLTE